MSQPSTLTTPALTASGNYIYTATSGSLTQAQATEVVNPAAATHFTVAAPGTATAGTAISAAVTALDQYNNTATGYTGTVHITSTDAAATLPLNAR